jgi:hypothetical protein
LNWICGLPGWFQAASTTPRRRSRINGEKQLDILFWNADGDEPAERRRGRVAAMSAMRQSSQQYHDRLGVAD